MLCKRVAAAAGLASESCGVARAFAASSLSQFDFSAAVAASQGPVPFCPARCTRPHAPHALLLTH